MVSKKHKNAKQNFRPTGRGCLTHVGLRLYESRQAYVDWTRMVSKKHKNAKQNFRGAGVKPTLGDDFTNRVRPTSTGPGWFRKNTKMQNKTSGGGCLTHVGLRLYESRQAYVD